MLEVRHSQEGVRFSLSETGVRGDGWSEECCHPNCIPRIVSSASYTQMEKAVSHKEGHLGGHELFQPTKRGV